MPKPRNPENRGFPARWQATHGAIYYQVPPGLEKYWDGKKKFRLGTTRAQAYREWSKRVERTDDVVNVGDLLQRYLIEVTSEKPPESRKGDVRAHKMLLLAFHDVLLEDITPQEIYKYLDKRSAKIAARREKSMLSHAFTKAVEWGYIKKHPFKGELRLKGEVARTRYVEDWEIAEIMKMKPRRKGDVIEIVQKYIAIKNELGLRQSDMLLLDITSFTDEGIPVKTSKTGKSVVFTWYPRLTELVDQAKKSRPVDISRYLFCTRRGRAYTPDGWRSIWQRFMERVLTETKVKERFTEHDLRAKAGSDAPTKERASELLTHDSVATTVRAYRRKPERIRPVK